MDALLELEKLANSNQDSQNLGELVSSAAVAIGNTAQIQLIPYGTPSAFICGSNLLHTSPMNGPNKSVESYQLSPQGSNPI